MIAVLITCHNRREKTLECLNALFATTLPPKYTLNVFLVDDGSTDGTSEAVKKKFPKVHIIQGDGNLFWNRGMHLAWKIAAKEKNFDFYLWLNDDTFLIKDALITLIENSSQKGNEAILCGTTQSLDLKQYTYGGSLLKGKKVLPDIKLNPCDYINGNCVLVPKTVYKKIGMLDPIFPHAIGDFDYGLRAKKQGIQLFVASKPVGICELNNALPQWCLPNVPFLKRIRSLYSPLGNSHPYYYFIFEKRYFGIFVALKHFLSIHLRLFFPYLWKH